VRRWALHRGASPMARACRRRACQPTGGRRAPAAVGPHASHISRHSCDKPHAMCDLIRLYPETGLSAWIFIRPQSPIGRSLQGCQHRHLLQCLVCWIPQEPAPCHHHKLKSEGDRHLPLCRPGQNSVHMLHDVVLDRTVSISATLIMLSYV
jgi:hypothetical protein